MQHGDRYFSSGGGERLRIAQSTDPHGHAAAHSRAVQRRSWRICTFLMPARLRRRSRTDQVQRHERHSCSDHAEVGPLDEGGKDRGMARGRGQPKSEQGVKLSKSRRTRF